MYYKYVNEVCFNYPYLTELSW